ncbi:hypothetical protein SLA2020_347770 [Shorea laevis]
MLLVANNTVPFYSENTREYKSALLLRHLVTAMLQWHLKDSGNKPTTSIHPSSSPMHKPPAKPRSVRPGNRKLLGKVANSRNAAGGTSHGSKKPFNVDSPPSMDSLGVTKKGFLSQEKRDMGVPSKNQKPQKGRELVLGNYSPPS